MEGSLFISYSHVDAQWMHAVKKHLIGILMNRCRIWTDEDIPAGTTWEERLLGNLQQSAAGLVLVSPDYLISPWCRRELKSLADACKSNQLSAVYWVLLKPCGWKRTELAGLQAAQEPADQAVLSLPEGPQRDLDILRCCEAIADGLIRSLKDGDKVLGTIRTILARSVHGSRITPTKSLGAGDFSIVGQGVDANGKDVVIKVLTNTPLHRMNDLFFKVCQACSKINEPSVIRTTDIFEDGEGYEQRIVIVSEMARGGKLSKALADDARSLPGAERQFTLDSIRLLLERVAKAIEALHSMKPIPWEGGVEAPYRHLMGPLPPSSIFYDNDTQWPQISLVGVTNFLWHFFEPETFRRIVGSKAGLYVLPEKCAGKEVDERADQYFLGMLALELLERRTLFSVAENEKPAKPLDILENAHWAKRHEQLSELVSRLLAENPEKRFKGGMTEVIEHLRKIEDSPRALAKYSFRMYVAPEVQGVYPGVGFAESFYENLFKRAPEVKKLFADAQKQRTGATAVPDPTQLRKLMDGLKAVLNYRPGARPSSIDSVAARHVGFHLNETFFEYFEASFLETLEEHIKSAEEPADLAEIREAWKSLFGPVRAVMLGYATMHSEAEVES